MTTFNSQAELKGEDASCADGHARWVALQKLEQVSFDVFEDEQQGTASTMNLMQ